MRREEYVAAIKSAAISIGKKAVMSRLITLWAGFALPALNPIVGFCVGKILEIAIKETEMGVFFAYIDMRVDKQQTSFEKACYDYYEAQKGGSNEDIAIAEDALKKEFAAFVSLSS